MLCGLKAGLVILLTPRRIDLIIDDYALNLRERVFLTKLDPNSYEVSIEIRKLSLGKDSTTCMDVSTKRRPLSQAPRRDVPRFLVAR